MVKVKNLLHRIIVLKWSNFYGTSSNCTPPPHCTPSCPSEDKKDSNTTKTNRLIRQEPGEVRLGFIPHEWFEMFFKKTGVSGFGTLCFTVGITLISKEYYVLEHEYYNGLSMAVLCIGATKNLGPGIAKYLDAEIEEYENSLKASREAEKKQCEELIENESKLQHSSEGSLMLVAAKRENVDLQREAIYRQRCMYAYEETIKRLEYCATREIVELAIAKRCMTDWLVEEVRNAVTKEIQEKSVNKCIEDLKYLADTYDTLNTPYPPEAIDNLHHEEPTRTPPKTPDKKK